MFVVQGVRGGSLKSKLKRIGGGDDGSFNMQQINMPYREMFVTRPFHIAN